MSAMSASAVPSPSALPEVLPLFPLSGVLLLPRAKLPLNVFEPRYMAMIDDALAQPGRLIGIIQPHAREFQNIPSPPLYKVGCAGRISSFNETEDSRFMITLTGLCRFEMLGELPPDRAYRRAQIDWTRYAVDLNEEEERDGLINRDKLLEILQIYFRQESIDADWRSVENTPDEALISSLSMICPFEVNERQALLEAPDLASRADLLMALLEMASLPQAPEHEGGLRH